MNQTHANDGDGPIEAQPWPAKLAGYVTQPGPSPRILGYDVENDLARHYSWPETLLLTLTGDLPTPQAARAFELAMTLLAPMPVSSAPAHAGVLAQLCSTATGSKLGIITITLAQQAQFELEEHAELLAWLCSSQPGAPPPCSLSRELQEEQSVLRLRDMLASIPFTVPRFDVCLSRTSAAFAVLHACGLRNTDSLACALVLARLACCVAESCAIPPKRFRDYPMLLPPFRYEPRP